jgi:hypothetical protein
LKWFNAEGRRLPISLDEEILKTLSVSDLLHRGLDVFGYLGWWVLVIGTCKALKAQSI